MAPLVRHVQYPLERGVVRPKPRAHMLHIGKTGGTAIKDVLKGADGSERYEIVAHRHSVRMSDIPRGEKVFFVVRDPVDRFVSAFNSRLRRGQPRHFTDWSESERIAFSRFESADSLGRALSSDDTDERAQAFTAMISIRHVRDSYWRWFSSREYLDTRLEDLLLIQWFPDLTPTFPMLRELLGLRDDAELPTDDLRSHRTPRDVDRSLGDVARANLEKWFGSDYAFIDYCAHLDCFAGPSRVSVEVTRPGSDLSETAPASDLLPEADASIERTAGEVPGA